MTRLLLNTLIALIKTHTGLAFCSLINFSSLIKCLQNSHHSEFLLGFSEFCLEKKGKEKKWDLFDECSRSLLFHTHVHVFFTQICMD